MTQLDMISDTIAKLEATMEDAKTPLAGALPAEHSVELAPKRAGLVEPSRAPKPQPRLGTNKKCPRTKRAMLLALMARKSGATISAMMEATGWQAHSVRAGLTGLRKDGIMLERSTNRRGETVYIAIEETAAR